VSPEAVEGKLVLTVLAKHGLVSADFLMLGESCRFIRVSLAVLAGHLQIEFSFSE